MKGKIFFFLCPHKEEQGQIEAEREGERGRGGRERERVRRKGEPFVSAEVVQWRKRGRMKQQKAPGQHFCCAPARDRGHLEVKAGEIK